MHVELNGSTLRVRPTDSNASRSVRLDPCGLTESDIFFHLGLRSAEAIEEIALAAGGEIEHREPDRRAVGVTRLEPGFEGGVGADVGVDGADRNLFSHGGDCSLGIAGELLSVQDLGLGGSKCLLGAGDACRLGVDQALNFRERLGNDGIVGTQEIDLLQRLLLGSRCSRWRRRSLMSCARPGRPGRRRVR